ncbi:hypothetical protein [Actinoplanes sp. NPDC049265]|uniref:hypothetical protein n=1 Tax=Actinoplanes sp. NPDC049265 TaxID=3363902 RepID=UPI00371F606B
MNVSSDGGTTTEVRTPRGRVVEGVVAVGGLVAIVLLLTSSFERLSAVVNLIIGLLGALAALLAVPWVNKRLTGTRIPLTPLVRVLLAAEIVVAGVSLGVRHYRSSHEVDVLDQVSEQLFTGVQPGREVQVQIPLSADRRAIAVAIEITDHNPGSGICAPFTTVDVRQAKRAIYGSPRRAHSAERITIVAPRAGAQAALGVAVANDQDERNCLVDLRISVARLTNQT